MHYYVIQNVYYYNPLRVSSNTVLIIRRSNCINVASVSDHPVHGRPHRVTYTRHGIDTVNSSDDGHMVARNMWRIEINIQEKFVHQVDLFTKIVLYLFMQDAGISQFYYTFFDVS